MKQRGIEEQSSKYALAAMSFARFSSWFGAGSKTSGLDIPGEIQMKPDDAERTSAFTLSASSSRQSEATAGQPTPGSLWISVSKRTGFRRLHLHGACWYRAEVTEQVTDHANIDYNAPCRVCWKGEGDAEKVIDKLRRDEVTSLDSDEESSSSVEC